MTVILDCAFSQDGKYLAAVSSKELFLFSIETQRVSGRDAHSRYEFSNDSNRLDILPKVIFMASNEIAIYKEGIILLLNPEALRRSQLVPTSLDPDFIIRRIATPTEVDCLAAYGSYFLLGGTDGHVIRIDFDGRICSRFEHRVGVTALKVVRGERMILGTAKGELLLASVSSGETISAFTSTSGAPISSISIDPQGNWFSATSDEYLISGSTNSLAVAFETNVPMPLKLSEFVNLSSSGLSLIAAGLVPHLRLLPLDLSSQGTVRMQFDTSTDLCAVTCSSRSNKGDLIAFAGVGDSILLFSANALQLVSRLPLE
jgi:WD40 repeat protein